MYARVYTCARVVHTLHPVLGVKESTRFRQHTEVMQRFSLVSGAHAYTLTGFRSEGVLTTALFYCCFTAALLHALLTRFQE
jgi:hypothetical protein